MPTPATPTPIAPALLVPVPAGHLTIKRGEELGTIPATARLLDHVRRLSPGTPVVFLWHSATRSTSGRHVPLAVAGHAFPDAVVVDRLEIAAYELAAQIAGISPTVTAPLADLAFDGTLGDDDEEVDGLDDQDAEADETP